MLKNFLNKMRKPEQPIDPRARLAALVEVRHGRVTETELRVTAGLESEGVLERERANLSDAEKALADFDAERDAAATAAERRKQRSAALLADAQAADSEMSAAAEAFDRARAKALAVAETIERDFRLPGRVAFEAPFTGSAIVERLRFWSRGVTVRHAGALIEEGAFADRLVEFRRLLEPPKQEPAVHRPTPAQIEANARKRRERNRNALENNVRVVGKADGTVVFERRPIEVAG